MEFSLNYIWIQATRFSPPPIDAAIACPIPHTLIRNAVETAEWFSYVPVTIWIDFCGVGYNSSRILNSLNGEEGIPDNITFRALDDVPAYGDPDLYPEENDEYTEGDNSVYATADLARLHVLEYCLNQGQESAFYADMDLILTEDDGRPFIEAQDKLEQNGVVIGEVVCGGEGRGIENQFIGFSQRRKNLLINDLLPATLSSLNDDCWPDGYDAFWDVFSDHELRHYDLEKSKIGVLIHQLPDDWKATTSPALFSPQCP